MRNIGRRWIVAVAAACLWCVGPAASAATAKPLSVSWMAGFHAPGTPARYDKVGVIKIGPASAKNVLVLEPGTSAGSTYFVPLAQWIVAKVKGWQVWSVERRENLLEDQSVFNRAKQGKASNQQVFDYYLRWLSDSSIKNHLHPVADSSVAFARRWGLRVVVEDLRRVIQTAKKLGGRVVLGGHSLGGSVTTAYATWNFDGRPGAADLAGLVYDDGGSHTTPVSARQATAELQDLKAGSPWLAFSNIPAPYLGLFSSTGSLGALIDPNAPALGQTFPLLPASLKPPIPVTNQALFGYDIDVKTSQLNFSAQAHVGQLDTSVSPARWSRAGAITPIERYATMLSGIGVRNADGTEWYFPQRLTDDTGAIGNGIANPAQKVLNVKATLGRRLPKRLLIYAFGAYGGQAVLDAARKLARQSQIPAGNLTLIDRHSSYAHNDPAAAYPRDAFFNALTRFLKKVASRG